MKSAKLFFCIAVAIAISVSAMAAKPVVNEKITVNQTADKITITGGTGKKISSDKFALSKDGWYIIRVSYTGPAVSVCQLSLVDQNMITSKQTVGGLLTNWIGPSSTEIVRHTGLLKTEDYMIYVDESGGPWTIDILKSPKPAPVSADTAFKGTANKVTPFFKLKKGTASFTIHQKLKGKFSARIEVNLYNADSGTLTGNLCHNSTDPELIVKKEVPDPGNYIFEISGGDSWDISYAQ
jgi:hypothetical protein